MRFRNPYPSECFHNSRYNHIVPLYLTVVLKWFGILATENRTYEISFPKEELSQQYHRSLSTTIRWLKELEDLGLIVRKRQRNKKNISLTLIPFHEWKNRTIKD